MRCFSFLFLATVVAAAAPLSVHAADPLQVRSMAAACASCHGTQGVALDGMETLAGKSKDELLKKMLDFKSGKKPATLLHQLSKCYSYEHLEQLFIYFFSFKP